MLGKSVLELAAASRHVVDARTEIQSRETMRAELLRLGQFEAAVALSLHIKALQQEMAYLDAALIAAASDVRHWFNVTVWEEPSAA
jgi:hypothetical protein